MFRVVYTYAIVVIVTVWLRSKDCYAIEKEDAATVIIKFEEMVNCTEIMKDQAVIMSELDMLLSDTISQSNLDLITYQNSTCTNNTLAANTFINSYSNISLTSKICGSLMIEPDHFVNETFFNHSINTVRVTFTNAGICSRLLVTSNPQSDEGSNRLQTFVREVIIVAASSGGGAAIVITVCILVHYCVKYIIVSHKKKRTWSIENPDFDIALYNPETDQITSSTERYTTSTKREGPLPPTPPIARTLPAPPPTQPLLISSSNPAPPLPPPNVPIAPPSLPTSNAPIPPTNIPAPPPPPPPLPSSKIPQPPVASSQSKDNVSHNQHSTTHIKKDSLKPMTHFADQSNSKLHSPVKSDPVFPPPLPPSIPPPPDYVPPPPSGPPPASGYFEEIYDTGFDGMDGIDLHQKTKELENYMSAVDGNDCGEDEYIALDQSDLNDYVNIGSQRPSFSAKHPDDVLDEYVEMKSNLSLKRTVKFTNNEDVYI